MDMLEDVLSEAQSARLIPTVADSRKEERIVSILLATLSRVRPLAEFILERCDQRIGKLSAVRSYTEVEFPSTDASSKDRPDGLLLVTTRKTRWTALLEAKIENAEIDADQLLRYAEIARKFRLDAIITLSNQLVPLPTHLPYTIPKRVQNHVQLFHLSWISILTQALLILRNTQDIDPEQAFLLEEMARYFEHPTSGVRRFDQMNPDWRAFVLGVRDGQQYKRSSSEIENTVTSWHQEERDVALILSRRIGQQVSIRRLSRKHQADPALRLRDACDTLIASNELRSSFTIPNAASDLELTADVQRRTISCSMKLNVPLDRQRARARINWLRRQLRDVDGENIQVRAFWPKRAMATQASLSDVKADSRCLEKDRSDMTPIGFEVVMIRDIAGRFSGRRTFIEDLEKLVPEFYEEVGQHLRPWTPPPPSIAKDDPIHETGSEGKDTQRKGGAFSDVELDQSQSSADRMDPGFSSDNQQ
ncbi:MAG: hypothetical protein OXI64_06805 [Defluviicoccus sp.]|nr:hypothetical protein [Defluviicoccus sp.]